MAEDLGSVVHCTCGDWHWREATGSSVPGLFVREAKCPRCDRWMLLIWRIEAFPVPRVDTKVVPINGRNADSLRLSLEVAGVGSGDIESIVQVARLGARAS